MSRRAIGIYAFFIALFGVFCYFAHRYDYFAGDLSISQWLQDFDAAWFKPMMQYAPYIVGLGVLIGLKLWLRPRWRAFIFTASLAGAGLIAWLIKLAVNRPRPPAELVQIMVGTQATSFPSGHMAMATAIGGFIFYLAPRWVKTPLAAGLLQALLIVIIAAIGVSRLYLGAHWLSDVVGGLFLGGLLLYPAIVLYKRYEAKNA